MKIDPKSFSAEMKIHRIGPSSDVKYRTLVNRMLSHTCLISIVRCFVLRYTAWPETAPVNTCKFFVVAA
jgi:hypothetical protein